jgi:hypothetical protein
MQALLWFAKLSLRTRQGCGLPVAPPSTAALPDIGATLPWVEEMENRMFGTDFGWKNKLLEKLDFHHHRFRQWKEGPLILKIQKTVKTQERRKCQLEKNVR